MAKGIFLLDILVLILVCFLMNDAEAASPPTLSTLNCRDRCGNVTIPFPFGMGRSECFLDEWYEIDCQDETVPFLKKVNLEVLNISLPIYGSVTESYVSVKFPIVYSNPNCYPKVISQPPNLQGSPFFFSSSSNIFAAVGCNVNAMMKSSDYSFVGCKLECSGGSFSKNSTCSGFDGCCQTRVPFGLQTLNHVEFSNLENEPGSNEQQCNYALLASHSWLRQEFTDLDSLRLERFVPVILLWGILKDNYHGKVLDGILKNDPNANYDCSYGIMTYDTMILLLCNCRSGYAGNGYLIGGCQDINECEDPSNRCPGRCKNTQGSYDCMDPSNTLKVIFPGIGFGLGALLLVLLGWWLYRITKKRKEKKLKEKYFKQNGGLILQQQLLSSEGNVLKGKLFNQKEIEMATENFSESRVLGKGGQGTVYKGMLTDGRIVAIKKALAIDEEKVEQFVNEVMILTQISHRNIVQLLGCCLETEIPLLVYEFIPNGNLYEYLHGSNKENPVSWEVRLQLATEIAGALFYLHSAASLPVYHRDIKSTNILLDEKYQARIADFGTSRSLSLDQSHVTTLIQGTIGYLDPEFFQTNQFTDKSDVYSFGVVLVELLTRQKPISAMRTEEGINLATYFLLSMEDGHVLNIVDAEVLNQCIEEEIIKVANLAQRCLQFHGRNRPTMREVTIQLEGIKKLQHMFNIQESGENQEQVQCRDILRSASTMFEVDTNVTTSSDI